MAKAETFTIESETKRGRTDVWVWGHSVYERGSVLAGQQRRRRVDCFDTVEAAKAAHPTATVRGASSHAANRHDADAFSRMPAPSDFDPADAGESWDGDY